MSQLKQVNLVKIDLRDFWHMRLMRTVYIKTQIMERSTCEGLLVNLLFLYSEAHFIELSLLVYFLGLKDSFEISLEWSMAEALKQVHSISHGPMSCLKWIMKNYK